MIILGIDPGIATVGYGVIEAPPLRHLDDGAIWTPQGTPQPERLAKIHQWVFGILGYWQPDCVAVERLYFSKNVTSAMQVAEARGVTLLAAAERRIPVAEYTPQEVKVAVTGSGKAGKRQVQEMVRRLLDLDKIPRPDDAADALAVAICHANRWRAEESGE